MSRDWKTLVGKLAERIRFQETPVGLKYFENRDDALNVPRVRVPNGNFTCCQLIWQSITYGWTVAVLPECPPMKYCAQVNGIYPINDEFYTGEIFMGGWFNDPENARKHHEQLDLINKGGQKYEVFVVSPLTAGKIEDFDVCILHLNGAQAFLLMSGYLNQNYEKLELTFGGETECSNSWIRTMLTRKPTIAIPSFAERKLGQAKENELVLAFLPDQLETAISGLDVLYKNGLRYPIPAHGLTCDAKLGLPKSYFNF